MVASKIFILYLEIAAHRNRVCRLWQKVEAQWKGGARVSAQRRDDGERRAAHASPLSREQDTCEGARQGTQKTENDNAS
jgi:hypothetical protein